MTTPDRVDQFEALHLEVEHYRHLLSINRFVDEQVESATKRRLALKETLDEICPQLLQKLNAVGFFMHTFDETMSMNTYLFQVQEVHYGHLPATPGDIASLVETGGRYQGTTVDPAPGWDATVIAQRLDVAGEFFGAIGLILPYAQLTGLQRDHTIELLYVIGEELDNYLQAIQQSRLKQRLLVRISDALKHPVLDTGIEEAAMVLAEVVPFDRMVVFYHDDAEAGEALADHRLHYKVFQGRTLIADSRKKPDAGLSRLYRVAASRTEVLDRATAAEQLIDSLAKEIGESRYREEFLINGVVQEAVVGKILVSSGREEFHPFNRDLIERFADAIRQRVVDFNKTRRHLHQFFSTDDTERLLATADYERQFLDYREAEIAILYTDICSFTKIAEKVLTNPTDVGRLINSWSERAAEVVWRNGGVLDKLVGDCLIALFGPPFFEMSPAEMLRRALDTSLEINDLTMQLGMTPEYEHVAQSGVVPGLACSAGVNVARVTVGFFGPNGDYTCFGSGMNTTARLQAAADFGQTALLETCMPIINGADLANAYNLSDPLEATGKNLGQAFQYRVVTRR